MRSVVVVLPASMCAAMPMLRVRSSEYSRLGELTDFVVSAVFRILIQRIKSAPMLKHLRGASKILLPAEMSECLVGLRHLVNFVAFADGVPLPLISLHDFRRERFAHGRALAGVREIHNPAERQGGLPVRWHFQRNLIRGAADAAGLGFDARF